MKLLGRRALVTGASSGIGRQVARALQARGTSLLLTGRDGAALEKTAEGFDALIVPADLSSLSGTETVVRRAREWGQVDIVVHSAGIGSRASATEQDDAELEQLLSVNFMAPVRLTRSLLPGMVSRGCGRLVFITSIAGELGVAKESGYAASKAALAGYAASLAAEVTGSGVGVTTVMPGVVDTPFFRRRGATYDRGFPQPIPAVRVATAVVRGIQQDRSRVVVPAWLRIPVALNAGAPQLYARLAAQWDDHR